MENRKKFVNYPNLRMLLKKKKAPARSADDSDEKIEPTNKSEKDFESVLKEMDDHIRSFAPRAN